jgi:hypothetical protein
VRSWAMVRDPRLGAEYRNAAENGLPGAPNQYRRYAPCLILCKPAQPQEGWSGAREGGLSEGCLREWRSPKGGPGQPETRLALEGRRRSETTCWV